MATSKTHRITYCTHLQQPRRKTSLQNARLPYFHTWCGLSANSRCRFETFCTRLAENTGRKNLPKIAIWAPSHNFVGLYLSDIFSSNVLVIQSKANFMAVSSAGNIVTLLVNRMLFIMSILWHTKCCRGFSA